VVAVDGKTLRGSATGTRPGRHLLAALDHDRGVVLGQVDVEVKTNGIPMLPVLLDKISLRGAIVTADAMHAQREHARYLVDQRGAHYILIVKDNQPKLRAQLAALPWRDVPPTAARPPPETRRPEPAICWPWPPIIGSRQPASRPPAASPCERSAHLDPGRRSRDHSSYPGTQDQTATPAYRTPQPRKPLRTRHRSSRTSTSRFI
jgi:hypothetical protein